MRLDSYLVYKKFCSSRVKAKDVINNGLVAVNGIIVTKASYEVIEDVEITVEKSSISPFVSRGGLKLDKAINSFKIDFKDKIVLDIGASTGGFTDCSLKHGAKLVWAIDVGTEQLDISLKNNSKVNSLENTDFRKLDPRLLGGKVDIIVADLSFISLKHILGNIPKFLFENGVAIILIKPQFEAGPKNIGKGGIVKNKKIHHDILKSIIDLSDSIGLYLVNLTWAPIIDSRKNIEYLALYSKKQSKHPDYKHIVDSAFENKKES